MVKAIPSPKFFIQQKIFMFYNGGLDIGFIKNISEVVDISGNFQYYSYKVDWKKRGRLYIDEDKLFSSYYGGISLYKKKYKQLLKECNLKQGEKNIW